ncbi:MAG: 2-oxo acid dehydrogenase subunit E2 [Actinomycetia bacterium]|nr:2-oxo acid dehydrogenase subunit E2 [Actinomycetes bacterium]
MGRRFGDRRDAVRVRDVGGLQKIMVCLKPLRADSDVYIAQTFDVTRLVRYMADRKAADPHLTYFHAFSCALGKLLYARPLLNRYVLARRFYDRAEASLGFVAKVQFADDAKENVSLVRLAPSDTLDDVKATLAAKVATVRAEQDNSTDATIGMIGKLPQWLVNVVVWVLKQCDVHDWLPASMIDDDIYHASIIVSNLGSIGCGAIYHNLTDFGTSSILVTIGPIRRETTVAEDGSHSTRDVCDFGITCDERIADGFYFAQSVGLLGYILDHPELLDRPLGERIAAAPVG